MEFVMKKTIVSILIGTMFGSAHGASLQDINISGFGSVAVGQSNNDVGYAGYTDERYDVNQDTLAGVQLDININDKAKFTAQVVGNGRYDYDLTLEMAYLSYSVDSFTVRAGKLRAPLFMYSDYLDVGYAYPMLRPSTELYDNFAIRSYTGIELLIPIEFEDSSLLIQPLVGTSSIAERDSTTYGEVGLDDFFGAAVHWYVDDFTFRVSYVSAQTDYYNDDADSADPATAFAGGLANSLIGDKHGQFTSLGSQYDDGSWIAMIEATDVRLEDEFTDVQSASGLIGYRFGAFMPYVMANWMKTIDDDEREASINSAFLGELSYKATAYSLGGRWDFAKNMALKTDLTYADFHGTSGGISATADDAWVYSVAIDFIF